MFERVYACHYSVEGWRCSEDHGGHALVSSRELRSHVDGRAEPVAARHCSIVAMIGRPKHQLLVLATGFGELDHGRGRDTIVRMCPDLVNVVVVAGVTIEIGHGGIRVEAPFFGHFGHGVQDQHLLPECRSGFTVVTPRTVRSSPAGISEAI